MQIFSFTTLAARDCRHLLVLAIALVAMEAATATPTREDMIKWLDEYRFASEGPDAGTIIGIENIDQLEPFVPLGFFDDLQFP